MIVGQFVSKLLVVAIVLLMPLAGQASESAYCGVLKRELNSQLEDTSEQLEQLEKTYGLYMQDYEALRERVGSEFCRRENLRSFFRNRLTSCDNIEKRLQNTGFMLGDIEKQRDKLLEEQSRNPNKKYILQLLGDNRCGTQYQRYARRNDPQSLPDWLIDDRTEISTFYKPRNNNISSNAPDGSNVMESYSTVCVRTCDGYYFPISFATIPEYFDIDSEQCNQSCPLGSAELYFYKNSGETIENAVSLWGTSYISHSNAFAYRDRYIKQCSCNTQLRQFSANN